ncbi:MAG: PTS sugar transporter subunit IIA [Desulfobulbus sp.]|jgi:PTS system nitrogen regulatory IIA component
MSALHRDAVILEMKATTKEGALRELAGLAATRWGRCTEETLYRILSEREHVGSTSVGNGVAIPHGKVEGLDGILLCFGRSRIGLNFDAIDKRSVYLFVLVLAQAGLGEEYLEALARASLIVKEPGNRQKLLEAVSKDEVLEVFADWETILPAPS